MNGSALVGDTASVLLAVSDIKAVVRRQLHMAKLPEHRVGRVRLNGGVTAEVNVLGPSGRIVLTIEVDRRTGKIRDCD